MQKIISIGVLLFALLTIRGTVDTFSSINIDDLMTFARTSEEANVFDGETSNNRIATVHTNASSQIDGNNHKNKNNRTIYLNSLQSLRAIFRNLSEYDSMLELHSKRLYSTTKQIDDPCPCQYYVVALRQIII